MRNFRVEDYEENFIYGVPDKYLGYYAPTEEERRLLVDRIKDRIMHSKSNEEFLISMNG